MDLLRRTKDPVLWGVVAAGALVRAVYWLTKWNTNLKLNDSMYYSGQAYQLGQGRWFRELFVDQPGAEHGPLTSLLMAPVSWMDDQDVRVRLQRLVTVVTGIALVWVIGRLGTQVAGRRAGLMAAGVAAVYPNLWMNDGLVMSESISMLLVALALWAAWNAASSGSTRDLVLLGVALGLGTLARSEVALMAVLLVVWVGLVLRRHGGAWRRAALAWAVCGAVLAPWVGFNLARFEEPVLLTTNDGTTLLGANCPETYSGEELGGWFVFCVVKEPEYRMEEEPSVRSVRQRDIALHFMWAHKRELPKVILARVGRTLDLYGLDSLVHQDVGEDRPRWASWAGIGMFWCLAVMAVFGARRVGRRLRSVLLIPVAVSVATTVLFYGGHRIRSTAEPSVVLLAAVLCAEVLVPRAAAWRQARSASPSGLPPASPSGSPSGARSAITAPASTSITTSSP